MDDEDIQTEDSASPLIRAASPWWTASHVQTSSMMSAEEARRCFSIGSQIWGGASANFESVGHALRELRAYAPPLESRLRGQ